MLSHPSSSHWLKRDAAAGNLTDPRQSRLSLEAVRGKDLMDLAIQERREVASELLQEQVIDQRGRLHRWRELTHQPAQIDTGYVAQHLVSIVSGIPGGGMRGKGEDLRDGSEVKSANFLDSLDARGAIAPRWNFMANDITTMEGLLEVPAIYLVSMDLNPADRIRARVWRLDPSQHHVFRSRYIEWMEKLGRPKLADPRRPYANFQLFPPRLRTADNFARHGNDHPGGFSRLRIELEVPPASKRLFLAEADEAGKISVKHIEP